ncbi:MAG: GNAT family N-acetyltransferase [Planctomycetia bacterium]|nr:MAG: GNAT family N-acetyltransferase [Planctomycetia bacterium]
MTTSLIDPPDLTPALAYALMAADDRRPATAITISKFNSYALKQAFQTIGRRYGPARTPKGVAIAHLMAGRTALLQTAIPGRAGVDSHAQLLTLQALLADLRDSDITHVQVLLEPDDIERAHLLRTAGLRRMTALQYQHVDLRRPAAPCAIPGNAEWVSVESAGDARFCDIIGRTYEGTMDCPELAGFRTVADAYAGHVASREAGPYSWELLELGGAPVGVVLVSSGETAGSAELVYCGVVTAQRGRGAGDLLVARAIERARSGRATRLVLAVDDRNAPALRLYARHGLKAIARREVFYATRSDLARIGLITGA